ncbi:unnamed protein product [Danaus chrysippus]|uniref:(African queen) hypothetical protein n=1 Tax=Danaus chrysippus TaxID=151541 RepID=A0A8J2R184_9NEOP|nr:unnamed protein product [Danaus chrysippus]
MKIPENPYYGNNENTQWQPNGVIIDSGVGGGVVGSGDAGARPVYPVHIPRHIPGGYVMTNAYYPPYVAPPPVPDDFEDYMWMENEEEFDKQVMQQLEEEALMEQCIEAMLEDEQRERHRTVSNGHCATTSSGSCNLSLEETVSRSTLNPLAAEFVPSGIAQTNTHTEEKQENPEVRQDVKTDEENVKQVEAVVDNVIENKEEANQKQPTDIPDNPPEVSEEKKTKPEVKSKTKNISKSDTKVAVKRSTKNERTDENLADVKPPTEESGFKPINYAAAAKANKPKKPEQDKPKSDKPAEKPKSDKPAEKPKSEKPVKPADKEKKPLKDKPKVKTDKPVQRKNSAK